MKGAGKPHWEVAGNGIVSGGACLGTEGGDNAVHV
jgi:hypothetical protein